MNEQFIIEKAALLERIRKMKTVLNDMSKELETARNKWGDEL